MADGFELVVLGKELAMDSREIAKLTGKRHDNVLRDIRKMLEELGESAEPKIGLAYNVKTYKSEAANGTAPKIEGSTESNFAFCEYKDKSGKANPYYLLDYDLTLTLLTGYSVVLRNKIIKRWVYLEKHHKESRAKSIEVRKDFTGELSEHGYTKRHEYIQTTKQMKGALGLGGVKKSEMSASELRKIFAAEALAGCLMDGKGGYGEVNPECVKAAEAVALATGTKALAGA